MFLTAMAKTVLKSLFSKPATRLYPFEKREPFSLTRGQIAIDIDACIFCGLCQRKCPTGAILVDKATSNWTIQRLACIQCNYCVETCPKKCLMMKNQYAEAHGAGQKSQVDVYTKTHA